MYPHERSLVKQLANKPFVLIGVNSDSSLKKIREIVKEKNLTWRSFQNSQSYGNISDDWGIRGWPSIFVLDQKGRIRYRDVRGSQMDNAIETLLSEMGHEVEISHEDEEEKKKAKDKPAKKADADAADDKEKRERRKKARAKRAKAKAEKDDK